MCNHCLLYTSSKNIIHTSKTATNMVSNFQETVYINVGDVAYHQDSLLHLDISDLPMKRGITTNRNKFVLGPVSYTHLHLTEPLGERLGCFPHHLTGENIADSVHHHFRLFVPVVTVSYTHLMEKRLHKHPLPRGSHTGHGRLYKRTAADARCG